MSLSGEERKSACKGRKRQGEVVQGCMYGEVASIMVYVVFVCHRTLSGVEELQHSLCYHEVRC